MNCFKNIVRKFIRLTQDNKVAMIGHFISLLGIIGVGLTIYYGFSANQQTLMVNQKLANEDRKKEYYYWKINKIDEMITTQYKIEVGNRESLDAIEKFSMRAAHLRQLSEILIPLAQAETVTKELIELCWRYRFIFNDEHSIIIDNIKFRYEIIEGNQKISDLYYRGVNYGEKGEIEIAKEMFETLYLNERPSATPVDENRRPVKYFGTMLPNAIINTISGILDSEYKETGDILKKNEF